MSTGEAPKQPFDLPFPVSPSARLASMDQFRGYAILAMIFVNFVGRFDVTPWMLKHHRLGMSYNDTIAPIFIFVVGMGFRLSMQRRVRKDGPARAYRAVLKRYAILTGIGFVVYVGYYWDALTDIGVAGFLSLPFILRSARVRTAAAAAYLGLYQVLFSLTGYGDWVLAQSLNGGPLGPLSWAFILLLGTVAYDLLATRNARAIAIGCLGWGIGLSLMGWILETEWPGVKSAWPFTQYGMSAPYPLYATGLAFLTLLLFDQVCDRRGFQFPHLTVLGENPLVMYGAHGILIALGALCLSDRAPVPVMLLGFLVIYGFCYALARCLHACHIIVKI